MCVLGHKRAENRLGNIVHSGSSFFRGLNWMRAELCIITVEIQKPPYFVVFGHVCHVLRWFLPMCQRAPAHVIVSPWKPSVNANWAPYHYAVVSMRTIQRSGHPIPQTDSLSVLPEVRFKSQLGFGYRPRASLALGLHEEVFLHMSVAVFVSVRTHTEQCLSVCVCVCVCLSASFTCLQVPRKHPLRLVFIFRPALPGAVQSPVDQLL